MGRLVALLGAMTATGLVSLAPAPAPAKEALVARPGTVDFHAKHVGTENYKRTRITNRSGADVRLLVTAGLPDDFGFGLMPGQSCPVFSPGDVLPAGESCDAVVRFSPTDGFIGWRAEGQLIVTATDPETGAQVAELTIPVYGQAVP